MRAILICPVHGPVAARTTRQRVRWIVTHRACFDVGITEHDSPRAARDKAREYWQQAGAAAAAGSRPLPGEDVDEWVDRLADPDPHREDM